MGRETFVPTPPVSEDGTRWQLSLPQADGTMVRMAGPRAHLQDRFRAPPGAGVLRAPGEARVQGVGGVGSQRVSLTSAPLSGALHFHFAVGPAHPGASPELPACSPHVSSRVTPDQTAACVDA